MRLGTHHLFVEINGVIPCLDMPSVDVCNFGRRDMLSLPKSLQELYKFVSKAFLKSLSPLVMVSAKVYVVPQPGLLDLGCRPHINTYADMYANTDTLT